MTTTPTETAPRRPVFPATAALWRFVTRSLRYLWRRKLKITLWLATLITLAWQYENWHGRRAYKEQLALFRAEYGDLKWADFAPPRIPDEENFFAAPVFETFVVKDAPPRSAGRTGADEAYRRKADAMREALPHARFLRLKLPELASVEREVPRWPVSNGLELLDVAAWAKAEAAAGQVRPAGISDAQWLHASMPADATVTGFREASSRSKAATLPHLADLRKIGEELNDPAAIPLPAVSGLFGAAKVLSLRARVAARAGDGLAAEELSKALLLVAGGYSGGQMLITSLIGVAVEGLALEAAAEAVASRCWDEPALGRMTARLATIDEEGTLFRALYVEGFQYHLWPGDIREWHREAINRPRSFGSKPVDVYLWLCAKGPDGWVDANLANHLSWWREALKPDKPGDNLADLGSPQMNLAKATTRAIREFAFGVPSPRAVWAMIAVPALSNVCSSALQSQTRRRQLLLAIAIERYLLAKGTLPQKPADLVPAYLDAIPGDPYAPGTPLRWEVPDREPERSGDSRRQLALRPDGQAPPAPERSATSRSPVIRYRILSAHAEAKLGFPEKLP